jgi:hypothetical protein
LLKKNISIMLLAVITALGFLSPLSTHAQTSTDQAKIRSKVQALGVNPDKKIEVKLRDTTKVKGYITSVNQDNFIVSNTATNTPETIAYSDVVDIKKSGGGLSTKSWLIIGGAAAGAIVTWAIVKPAVCDGGAQTRGIC